MSADQDVSRDAKKTWVIVATVVFVLVAGGFLLLSWIYTPPPPVSRINVDKVSGGAGKIAPESPQYRAVLKADNEEGARKAQHANASFIASVGAAPEPAVPPPPPPSETAQPLQFTPPPPQYAAQVQPVQTIDPDRKKALEALLKELVAQRSAPVGQLASVQGMSGEQSGTAGAGKAVNPYAGWTQSLAPAVAEEVALRQTDTTSSRVVIPAGSRPGAVVDTAVDSDNTGSQVIVHIPAGPYAGATLMANGVKLAGDGVSIHFTQMSWNKDSWRIDAWAAQPDTLQSSVASSVNNRYVSRILLPAIAHGLGLGGELYANANTQIMSNGYNTLEGRVSMPDSKAVAGTILGGAAQEAGQVISNDAQKLPAKQALLDRGQYIAVLFMAPVKESDKQTSTPDTAPPGLRLQPAFGQVPAQ